MDNSDIFPRQRAANFKEWSPSVHYARQQKMPPTLLEARRIYDFELLYVRQGEAAVTIAGKRHSLNTGQLCFIPAGVEHQNEAVSAPEVQFIGIHFDFFDELNITTEIDMIVNESIVSLDKFGVEAVAETFAPLSENPVYTASPACVQLMEQLVHEFTMRQPGFALFCKAIMLQILALLLRSQHARALSGYSLHSTRIMELMAQIEAAPAEPWSSKLIAERLFMHEDYAGKLFRQWAGKPPSAFVQSVRLREARRLLRESDLPIEAVGRMTGYADIHYFSRLFRQNEGISPREYRKLSRSLL